jgi:hypothetical protein
LIDNLPPTTGDDVLDALAKTSYKIGANSAFLHILDALDKKFMDPKVMPMSEEAEAILAVIKFVGGETRAQQGTLDKL